MILIQKLGLAGLLGLAGCGIGGAEERLVQRNPTVHATGECTVERRVPFNTPVDLTKAFDTNADGNFDEILVTRGYFSSTGIGVPLRNYEVDEKLARATTHYVAPSLKLEQQLFTGFPDTRAMTPKYQAALGVVCREGNERWREK